MRLSLERQLLDAVEAAKEVEARSAKLWLELEDTKESEQRVYRELHSVKAELAAVRGLSGTESLEREIKALVEHKDMLYRQLSAKENKISDLEEQLRNEKGFLEQQVEVLKVEHSRDTAALSTLRQGNAELLDRYYSLVKKHDRIMAAMGKALKD